jgi:hypothetical protein
MFNAMLRIYQDPDAPHDMYPGLESCRHIKDLAKNTYDGEYLLRSDLVAQLSLLWSQSDCSRYVGLLRNSPGKVESAALSARSGEEQRDNQPRRTEQGEVSLESGEGLEDFTGSAAYSPALAEDLPIASAGTTTWLHAARESACYSRSDDVPSPPPRALG